MGFFNTCDGGKDPKNDFPGLSEDRGECLPLSGVPFPGTVHLPLKKENIEAFIYTSLRFAQPKPFRIFPLREVLAVTAGVSPGTQWGDSPGKRVSWS